MDLNREAGMGKTPDVVLNLLIINILVFFASYALRLNYDINIQDLGALYYFHSSQFHFYQYITHFFLHGDPMHLIFNMLSLYIFGSILERIWGPKKFLAYYLFAALGAATFDMLVDEFRVYNEIGTIVASPVQIASSLNIAQVYLSGVIGASGAIMGLIVAFGFLFPNKELYLFLLPIPIKAKYFVVMMAIMDLFGGFGNVPGDNIAHFAHLGGMIFGLILLLIWREKQLHN